MVKTRAENKRPPPEIREENAARRVRMKRCLEKAQQEEAFRELLTLIGANGGKIPYGGVDKLVKTYNKNGFKAVTRDNLYYRLKTHKNDRDSVSLLGSSVVVSERSSNEVISDLSDDRVSLRDVSNIVAEPNDAAPRTITAVVAKGGRRKGSTKKAAKENEEKK
jgi:hypothetical protein